jgi:hypothetical protein
MFTCHICNQRLVPPCGSVDFSGAKFSGSTVFFDFGAEFSGSTINFGGAEFSGGAVYFGAEFSGGTVGFSARSSPAARSTSAATPYEVELSGSPTSKQAAAELVRLAKEQGLSLTGPDGLLKQLTKTVIESALQEEITEHLGYEKHDPAGAGTGNIRNGSRGKTVLTEASGEVEIDVPRDRAGTFEPVIVKKRQRRLEGVDQVVLSLYAKGLTTGEISAHFAEIYGASVSKETISRITDRVLDEMADWATRPLDPVYAAVFIDAIVVKVRVLSHFP